MSSLFTNKTNQNPKCRECGGAMVSYTYTPDDIRKQLRKNAIIYQCLKCGERTERDVNG